MSIKKANGFSICFYHNINISIMTNAAIPGSPNKPEIVAVIKLIGTCKSILVPNAFRKNSSNAPIMTFTNNCPTRRIGFSGAPTIRTSNINPPNIEITTIGSNYLSLLKYNLYNHCMFVHWNKNLIFKKSKPYKNVMLLTLFMYCTYIYILNPMM